jgi:oligopeptide transport system substrate-binding protein
VARAGWCADYNEPTSFLNTMLSDSSNNTAHYKSPAFDKMIAETLKVTDEAQRTTCTRKQSSSWIKILRSYRFTTTLTPVW